MTNQDNKLITVAVLGGTGKEGSGLALRWAHAGYRVIIGSRTAEKAEAAAVELNKLLGGDYISGADNAEATAKANLIVLSVPYSSQNPTLESVQEHLAGKILVNISVPLQPPKVRQVHIPPGLSAALESQELLQGVDVRIVAAFQNVSATHLKDLDYAVDCDVLVCGDDSDAKEEVIKLVEAAGMRGLDAGPLANAVAIEALTPVLLYINKKYQVPASGIRITGLAEQ